MINMTKLNALRQKLQKTQAQIEIKKEQSQSKDRIMANKFLELYHKVDDLYRELDSNGHNPIRKFTYPLKTEVYHTSSHKKFPLDLVAFQYKSTSGELKSYICPVLRGIHQDLRDIRFNNDFSRLTPEYFVTQMTPGNEIEYLQDMGFPADVYKEITDNADDIYNKFEQFIENTLEQQYTNKIEHATNELDELEME